MAHIPTRGLWRGVILVDHPLRGTLLPCLHDGVNSGGFLVDSHRGLSASLPAFRHAEFSNRIPDEFPDFVDAEVESLIACGCVANGTMSKDRVAQTGPA